MANGRTGPATAFGFVAVVLYFQTRTLLVPMAFHAKPAAVRPPFLPLHPCHSCR